MRYAGEGDWVKVTKGAMVIMKKEDELWRDLHPRRQYDYGNGGYLSVLE